MRFKIAIFIHQPRCSIQSGNGIIKALSPYYDFKIFTKHEVEDDFFSDVDIACFPGGIGDSDAHDHLFRINGNAIKDYVKNGGKYVGICMGAYWADKHYFDILDGVEAHQYIKRPNTDIRRYYSTTAKIDWMGTDQRMFFYDGPAFVGDESKFETVARYANGDPMAIIQDNIGLIGCHPESDIYWYDKPYLIKHWHEYNHHKLLLEFFNNFAKK
jgi:glutamine amidotransferase-like uncharacterized protein